MCYLAPSVKQSCHCMAIILIFSSLALPISLAHGSGFKNFEEGLFLAISFSTILVDLEEIVGEWLGEVGLFRHSPLVTSPCLLAGGSFFLGGSPHHIANTGFLYMFLNSLAPAGDVFKTHWGWTSVVEAAPSI